MLVFLSRTIMVCGKPKITGPIGQSSGTVYHWISRESVHYGRQAAYNGSETNDLGLQTFELRRKFEEVWTNNTERGRNRGDLIEAYKNITGKEAPTVHGRGSSN